MKKTINKKKKDFIINSLEQLKKANIEVYSLFMTAIHSIFFRDSKSAAEGSTSSAVGLIWLNIKEKLDINDVVELLIHELTHNLLFIDEICHSHYNYDLVSQKDFYAQSSILQTKRPLDKVLHSIVVSTEIILSRKNYLPNFWKASIHPSTPQLIKQTLEAIESVYRLPINLLLKPRAMEILAKCKEMLSVKDDSLLAIA